MRRTLGVGIVLLLVTLLLPSDASAQQGGNERASRLGQNYPNPFNPTTYIPFTLFDEDFVGGRPAVVSIRIYSILSDLVAIPLAWQHPDGHTGPVENMEYTTPGQKFVYWEGEDRFGRKVGSGTYLVELVVNGRRAGPPMKIVVRK